CKLPGASLHARLMQRGKAHFGQMIKMQCPGNAVALHRSRHLGESADGATGEFAGPQVFPDIVFLRLTDTGRMKAQPAQHACCTNSTMPAFAIKRGISALLPTRSGLVPLIRVTLDLSEGSKRLSFRAPQLRKPEADRMMKYRLDDFLHFA